MMKYMYEAIPFCFSSRKQKHQRKSSLEQKHSFTVIE